MKPQHFKRGITLLIASALVVILFVFATVIWSLMTFDARIPYLTSISPSGSYEVELEYSPPFVFGAHTVHVYGRDMSTISSRWRRLKPRQHDLGSFSVANDGKSIEGLCTIQWLNATSGEVAEISCNGEEQSEEIHTIAIQAALD